MGLLSNKIDRQELKHGDHIYCWRQAFIYAHHGIYIGEGKVIHFTQGPAGQENGSFFISSSLRTPKFSDVPCPQCGDQNSSFSNGVILSCIDCFLSGGELNLFEYGVSLAYFIAKVRGGTCTIAPSDPPGAALHRANFLLENGFGDYDLFKNNCEDFAIYCKTGSLVIVPSTRGGQSGQAATLEATSGLIFSSLALVTYKFKGVAAVSSGVYYCYSRLNSDIGVRSDVAKVPVERLVPPAPPTPALVPPSPVPVPPAPASAAHSPVPVLPHVLPDLAPAPAPVPVPPVLAPAPTPPAPAPAPVPSALAPAPAPVSYDTSIDQGIAYVLMLVALFNQLRDCMCQIHHPARAMWIYLVAEILIVVFGVGVYLY